MSLSDATSLAIRIFSPDYLLLFLNKFLFLCQICVKPVYRMDPLINLDGSIIHKQCAKCGDCNCQITLSNFVKSEIGDQTTLLCKIHYLKRFSEVS